MQCGDVIVGTPRGVLEDEALSDLELIEGGWFKWVIAYMDYSLTTWVPSGE